MHAEVNTVVNYCYYFVGIQLKIDLLKWILSMVITRGFHPCSVQELLTLLELGSIVVCWVYFRLLGM